MPISGITVGWAPSSHSDSCFLPVQTLTATMLAQVVELFPPAWETYLSCQLGPAVVCIWEVNQQIGTLSVSPPSLLFLFKHYKSNFFFKVNFLDFIRTASTLFFSWSLVRNWLCSGRHHTPVQVPTLCYFPISQLSPQNKMSWNSGFLKTHLI